MEERKRPSAVPPQTAFSGKQNDLKCPPLCSGHHQRKNYFIFRDNGTPAGVPLSHFHGRGCSGRRHLQRRFLRKRGAAEKASANLQQAEPSQALPRQLSRRESFVCADRKIHKSSPFGGAGRDQRERTERVHPSGQATLRFSRQILTEGVRS